MKNEEKLELQISELRANISELEKRVVLMDRALDPIRRDKYDLEAQIRLTHFPKLFNPERAKERFDLFDQLTDIAEQHGPDFNERRELAQRSKAYQRAVEKLVRELTLVKKKPQQELF